MRRPMLRPYRTSSIQLRKDILSFFNITYDIYQMFKFFLALYVIIKVLRLYSAKKYYSDVIYWHNQYEMVYDVGKNDAIRSAFPRSDLTLVLHTPLAHLHWLKVHLNIWNGPISIAVFITEEENRTEIFKFLRAYSKCIDRSAPINKILFHVLIRQRHPTPENYEPTDSTYSTCTDIDKELERFSIKSLPTNYPINVARNIARKGSFTDYVMLVDIENIPSANFSAAIRPLLPTELADGRKNVLIVPRFEVENFSDLPNTKSELVKQVKRNKAFPFRSFFIHEYHRIPNIGEWLTLEDGAAKVFQLVDFQNRLWQPYFISHRNTPMHHELFYGRFQVCSSLIYEFCVANYTFSVVSNVFLTHIGVTRGQSASDLQNLSERRYVDEIISKQFQMYLAGKYGLRKICRLLR